MNISGSLKEYQSLLEDAAKAEIALKVYEKRLELTQQAPPTPRKGDVAEYIAANADWLTEAEIEFLQQPTHSPREVARHIRKSESTVKRLCDAGKLQGKKVDGRYRIDSVSVMEYLDAEPPEKT